MMIKENKASLIRVPFYLGISALAVTLAIAIVYAAVLWAGGNMFGTADLRSEMRQSGSPVDQTARDAVGIAMLFFVAVFLLAPSCAACIAITMAAGFIDFRDRKVGAVFRLFTLFLVLVGLWLLAPSIAVFRNKQGGVLVPVISFRWVYLCLNGFVGLIMTMVSVRKRPDLKEEYRP